MGCCNACLKNTTIAFILAIYCEAVSASAVKLNADASASGVYTDNITLGPEGKEESDFLLTANAGISAKRDEGRLRLNAKYNLQGIYRGEDDAQNSVNHNLNGNGSLEVLRNNVFLDGRASISQQNINLAGVLALDNITDSENRSDVYSAGLSPYLTSRFGKFAVANIRYDYDVTAYEKGISDNVAENITFRLTNGPSFHRLSWSGNYNNRKIDHEAGSDAEFESAGIAFGYRLTGKTSITASGGAESNTGSNLSVQDQSYWNAGINWNPSLQTSLGASYGERFFGSTHAYYMNHHTRRSQWSVSYTESLTTLAIDDLWYSATLIKCKTESIGGLYFLQCAPYELGDPLGADEFIKVASVSIYQVQFDTLFISKQHNANVSYQLGKSSLSLSAYKRTMEFQDQPPHEQHLGGNISWSRKYARETQVSISGLYQNIERVNVIGSDDIFSYSMDISKGLSHDVTGSLEYSYYRRDTDSANLQSRENRYTATIRMDF